MRCRKILHRFYVLNIRIHPYSSVSLRKNPHSFPIHPHLSVSLRYNGYKEAGGKSMTSEELIQLVYDVQKNKCESNTLELKKASKDCPKKLYDTLSSFSNQDEGGIILFGIDETDNYAISGVEDAQKLQKSINEKCKEMEPVVRPFITSAQINTKTVVSAEIPSVDYPLRPVFYKPKGRVKGSYIRVGDSDEPMTEAEVYGYEAFKKNIADDLYTIDGPLVYADEDLIQKFILQYRHNRPNTSYALSDHDILNFSGIYLESRPTLAGILTFSRAPQVLFPEYSILCLIVPGKEIGDADFQGTRFIENRRLDGPLMMMLEEAVEFVRRNARTKTVIDTNGKRADVPEYPLIAVREAILNALIHRDYGPYTRELPVQVTLFDNRLEIKSPGGLFGNATIDDLGHKRIESRNGRLVRILEDLGETEHRFSGIPTIYKQCEIFGLPKPEFMSRHGEFTVIFYPPNGSLRNKIEDPVPRSGSSLEEDLLNFCVQPKSRKEISEHFQMKWDTLNRNYIRELIKKNELALTMPDKPKSSRQKYFKTIHSGDPFSYRLCKEKKNQ